MPRKNPNLSATVFRPISASAAMGRLTASGVTLTWATRASDNELLSLPTVGRRTLAWVRANPMLLAPEFAVVRVWTHEEADALWTEVVAPARTLREAEAICRRMKAQQDTLDDLTNFQIRHRTADGYFVLSEIPSEASWGTLANDDEIPF